MIENSIVYSLLLKLGTGFMKTLENSFLVGIFLTQNDKVATVNESIFYKIYSLIRNLFLKLFALLKLD
ncbi:MAG: hypothetical protein ACRCW1_10880, partial [Anaerotignaceae bacterium]